jgi:hypothetical protein
MTGSRIIVSIAMVAILVEKKTTQLRIKEKEHE